MAMSDQVQSGGLGAKFFAKNEDIFENFFKEEVERRFETLRLQNQGQVEALEQQRRRIQALESDNAALRNVVESVRKDPDSVKAELARLLNEFAKTTRANSQLQTKCRFYKNTAREWKSRAWRIAERARPLQSLPGNEDSRADGIRLLWPLPPDISASVSTAGSSRPVSRDPEQVIPLDHQNEEPASTRLPQKEQQLLELPQQYTYDSAEESDTSGEHPSRDVLEYRTQQSQEDESPIVISERSLKRKRPNGSTAEDKHDRYTKIKTEELSSSPIVLTAPPKNVSGLNESLDLDEVGLHARTPRKKRGCQVSLSDVNEDDVSGSISQGIQDDLQQDNEPQAFVMLDHLHPGKSNDLIETRLASIDESWLGQPKGISARKARILAEQDACNERLYRRRQAQVAGKPKEASSGNLAYSVPGVPKEHSSAQDGGAAEESWRALRQRDPNILPRTSGLAPHYQRRRKSTQSGAAFISALAEDGDEPHSGKQKSTSHSPGVCRKPAVDEDGRTSVRGGNTIPQGDRLQSLLQGPTPERTALSPPHPEEAATHSTRPRSGHSTKDTPVTRIVSRSTLCVQSPSLARSNSASKLETKPKHQSRSSLPTGSSSRSSHTITLVTNTALKNQLRDQADEEVPTTRPEDEPLRLRHLSNLRLTDFKANPLYVPADETPSNSKQKRTPPSHLNQHGSGNNGACHDRNCTRCAPLAAFANLAGYQPASKRGLFDPSSSPPEAAAEAQAEAEEQPETQAPPTLKDGIHASSSEKEMPSPPAPPRQRKQQQQQPQQSAPSEEAPQEEEDRLLATYFALEINPNSTFKSTTTASASRPPHHRSPSSLALEKAGVPPAGSPLRAALVAQARTHLFADAFGKHRSRNPAVTTTSTPANIGSATSAAATAAANTTNTASVTPVGDGEHTTRFSRALTPPGYWDTEMPNTQQEAANRKRAQAMEREKVEERWVEALRGDRRGRWRFVDE